MNSNKQFLALWGLKWNPFSVELPTEALVNTKKVEQFCCARRTWCSMADLG